MRAVGELALGKYAKGVWDPPGLGSWTEPRKVRELLEPWSGARTGRSSRQSLDNWAGPSLRGWRPRAPKV